MKIEYLSSSSTGSGLSVSATIAFPEGTSHGDAIAAVLGALDNGERVRGTVNPPGAVPFRLFPSVLQPADVAPQPAEEGTRRRRRNSAEAETAAPPAEPPPAEAQTAGRRRRSAQPETPPPAEPELTDAVLDRKSVV